MNEDLYQELIKYNSNIKTNIIKTNNITQELVTKINDIKTIVNSVETKIDNIITKLDNNKK